MRKVKEWTWTAVLALVAWLAITYIQHRAYLRGYADGVFDVLATQDADADAHKRAPLPDAPAVFARPRSGREI